MHPAKRWGCSENCYIARFQAIHSIFVSIESNELTIFWHVHLIAMHFLQIIITAFKTMFEDVYAEMPHHLQSQRRRLLEILGEE